MLATLNIGEWILQLNPVSKPREIVVEVSTRCNLACIHCFRWACERFEEKDMTLSDYRKVVENAAESGVRRVVLTGWGEPTVNLHFFEMLSYAKSLGLEVVLNTNGVNLVKYIEDLVEVGVDEVYVSVDAVDVDMYEKIRRHGDLSVVLKAIAKLIELKKKGDSVNH